MKVSRFTKTLTGRYAKDFVRCSDFSPTALSLQAFLSFGKNARASDSFAFLRKEMPVRLANIMREVHLLPDKLHEMQPVKTVVALYEKSFCEIVEYENADSSPQMVDKFTDCIANIRERHSNVVETMAQGVMELKDRYGFDQSMEKQLQYFLNRFYLNRMSIRMLITQHVTLFGPQLNENHRFIGVIDPHTNVLEVVVDAFNNASQICSYHYGTAPDLRVTVIDQIKSSSGGQTIMNKASDYKHIDCDGWECIEKCISQNQIQMTYVPTHLHHIMFEVMKNAMRAVVEYHENSDSLPKIKVLVCAADENITIKVFDKGGGIPRSWTSKVFQYTFTTASGSSLKDGASGETSNGTLSPMAGYGYGLPLSRLYARYFNGDLTLSSVEGFGTDVILYLRRRPSEADELLPIFNRTSARQYEPGGIPIADWSNPYFTSDDNI